MSGGPESRAGLKLTQDRLSPEVLAQDVTRLVGSFREVLTRGEELPHEVTYRLDESPDGIALRVSQSSPEGVKSVILVIKAGKGGIHFIEASKSNEPEVYAHTPMAVKKVEKFLQNLANLT